MENPKGLQLDHNKRYLDTLPTAKQQILRGAGSFGIDCFVWSEKIVYFLLYDNKS